MLADGETVSLTMQGLAVEVLEAESRHMRLARVRVLPKEAAEADAPAKTAAKPEKKSK